LFHLEEWLDPQIDSEEIPDFPQKILDGLCDYAVENNLIQDGNTARDIFDTELMGILTPFPSTISKKFEDIRVLFGIQEAANWFYFFSQKTNYIRMERIQKNLCWFTLTNYGNLEVTINLSKPEKDPVDIEQEKNVMSHTYPKCLLCCENIGYGGRIHHPARQNHRIISIDLGNSSHEKWFLQYSPYSYYKEHIIVFAEEHRPMRIDVGTFDRITKFIELFPHYFLGSNADLPIVGGSILTHDHYQGGSHTFPMALAPIEIPVSFQTFKDIEAGILEWPMSVIRLKSCDRVRLVSLAEKILTHWRNYNDPSLDILAFSGDIPHNTITPIARKQKDSFELDLVLRNNRTTEEFPLGIFHPHSEVWHIKKENIGLIETMGLAILPGRLKEELSLLEKFLRTSQWREKILQEKAVSKHLRWIEGLIQIRDLRNQSDIQKILQEEVSKIILKVLEYAGVYKKNLKGRQGFLNFIHSLNQKSHHEKYQED
jgi:UDPglucose--hexose-1-phosphate uridylyltransferase